MKKIIISLLAITMLLSGVALAGTVEFNEFSIDIPNGFNTYVEGGSFAHYGDLDIDLTIQPRANIYSSLEDAVSQLWHQITINSDYNYEIINVNGIQIAVLKETAENESLGAIFLADKYCYIISYKSDGSLDDYEQNQWNTIVQSIEKCSDPISASDTSTESTDDGILGESPDYVVYDYPTLEKGSKGDEVKVLQQRLVDLYWLDGSVDGDYGNKTKDAIERFQEATGLSVTGIADGKTQAKLFADNAPEAEMSVSCSSVVMGNYSQTAWNVNGQSFTLTGNQTKTLKTPWGTYKFDARGEYSKID